MTRLLDYLKQLVSTRFYGSVVIKFERGKIVNVKKEESIDASQFN